MTDSHVSGLTDGLGTAVRVHLVSGSGTIVVLSANSEYKMTLSLAAGAKTCTASVVDVELQAYSPTYNFVAKSYDTTIATVVASSTNDATITITPVAIGETIIEVQFPAYDNNLGADSLTKNPLLMIYSQIRLIVTA